MDATDEGIVEIAQKHGGRYLITLSAWRDKAGPTYKACEHLVRAGRARWLGLKDSWGYGEPGPGIELSGKDRDGIRLDLDSDDGAAPMEFMGR